MTLVQKPHGWRIWIVVVSQKDGCTASLAYRTEQGNKGSTERGRNEPTYAPHRVPLLSHCTNLHVTLTTICPVCTENLVRFDLTTESLNVIRDGRADSLPLEPACLSLQAQEPA
jgi:hypothetical protein